MMKKQLLREAWLLVVCCLLLTPCPSVMAQTARRLTVNITADGKANMVGYLPDHPSGRAVVCCPGGGYSVLAMGNEGHAWAEYFNRQGIAFFVLTYRMPNGDRTIPMSDACTAIRMVRDSAASWHVNPFDVGIMGSSAGGHLASAVSTHAEFTERPDFSILFYPVISMDERDSHKGSVVGFLGNQRSDRQLVREFSSQHAVRRHLTPPAIILMTNDDRLVPPVTNGIAYYTAMRNAGNECALYVYPTGGHGFGFSSRFKYHDQMLTDLSTWLRAHQAPKADAVRVACIGNSITDGHGIEMSPSRGYPALLQQRLGEGFQVRNFGVSARTLLNKGDHPYMQEMAWRDALAFRPEVAVIKLGTNDSKPENWRYGSEFQSDLQQMIADLRSVGTKCILLCTPIPAFKPSWNISDSVIVNGIIPIQLKVAKKQKLQVVDLHTLMQNDGDKVQADGIHPNDRGVQRMAELIAAEVENALRKDRR
jgi:acetyl esterase/lipase/lysophospholipase L1-like esterase